MKKRHRTDRYGRPILTKKQVENQRHGWRLSEAEKKNVIGGRIYFARCESADQFIKIGWTKQKTIKKRFKGMQTGNPYQLKLIYSIPGSQDRERRIQRKFAFLRVSGEWFRPEQVLLDFISVLRKCTETELNTICKSNLNNIVLEELIADYKMVIAKIKDHNRQVWKYGGTYFNGDKPRGIASSAPDNPFPAKWD
jgi:predicted nuclease of restriction endonuclease-like (RecB) superfamily